MNSTLPSFFSFRSSKDLVRVGRNNDGGYLVSLSDIKKSDFLIGLGISDDWSFESDFTKFNNIEVNAFDGSINLKFFIKRFISELIKNPFNFYILRKVFSYFYFFRKKNILIQKFIGPKCNDNRYITLEPILNKKNKKNIFFKIDIEGSEYRLLDILIKKSSIISGLVIEFHDCDIHLDKIKNFIKKFSLKLVHVHANNFGLIRSKDKLPLVLELTFSKYAKDFNKKLVLPNKLDMPNNKEL